MITDLTILTCFYPFHLFYFNKFINPICSSIIKYSSSLTYSYKTAVLYFNARVTDKCMLKIVHSLDCCMIIIFLNSAFAKMISPVVKTQGLHILLQLLRSCRNCLF